MGMYINPGMKKLEWLKLKNAKLEIGAKWPAAPGKVLLSWVDNGPFDALGVCYSEREFAACKYIDTDPNDGREHYFFSVDKSALEELPWDESDKKLLSQL